MKKLFFVLTLSFLLCNCTNNSIADSTCSLTNPPTFLSNNGKMYGMISQYCSGIDCHSPGGSNSGLFLVTDDYGKIKPTLLRASASVINQTMPKDKRLQPDEIQMWKCWRDDAFPQ